METDGGEANAVKSLISFGVNPDEAGPEDCQRKVPLREKLRGRSSTRADWEKKLTEPKKMKETYEGLGA